MAASGSPVVNGSAELVDKLKTPASTTEDIKSTKTNPTPPLRGQTLPIPAGSPSNGGNTANGLLSSSPTRQSTSSSYEKPAPIGTPASAGLGHGLAGHGLPGAKSMPGSRRTSGSAGTFGLERLSLSVHESAQNAEGSSEAASKDSKSNGDEAALDESAQKSVAYLQLNTEDDGFMVPQGTQAPKSNKLSASSAALDLAPLSQTGQRFAGGRGLKTSEWPQFSGPPKITTDNSPSNVAGSIVGGAAGAPATPQPQPSPIASGRASPNLADSIASLPAMPMTNRSVPTTPGAGLGGSGLSGFTSAGLRKSSGNLGGIAGGSALEGLSASQRGFSNPDLAKAFSKVGPGFGPLSSTEGPRPYGNADPLYNTTNPPLVGGGNFGGQPFGAVTGFDNYGFDDDNFGSGALYPAGGIGSRNKRAEMDREFNRFAGMRIEDLQGELMTLCKDQHGCRYLQKKLEEEVPEHRDMIFRETYGHFPELMTDPFGNYLCQKLLEYSTEEQRNVICESVANDLVGISLNMHGTRAVQKMIDFLSNPRQPNQIRAIIVALSLNVVSLIKDLNGNHVIQKCLNKLIPEDNQFIYNAVANHCVEVATHRHGCCVLQRCIDHAADSQRVQLVTEITYNALTLVQDPFGNYVVQYVLDLNDHRFSEAVIRQFIGNVCVLSVQKFSSNVIEKCIRVADPELRKVLVGELLNRSRLEKLLRDSFANYVVQTALDYADPAQRMLLVECIRPILPMIRNTPYGKRIQSKLQREQMGGHHDPYGGYGQQSLMNIGNSYGNGMGGGYGYGGGGGYGRGGYGGHNHSRHLGAHALHHPNALTEVYGQPPPVPQWDNQHPHHGGRGGYPRGGFGHQNGMSGMHQPQVDFAGPNGGAGFDRFGPGMYMAEGMDNGRPRYGVNGLGNAGPHAPFPPQAQFGGADAGPIDAQATGESMGLMTEAGVPPYGQGQYAAYM